MGGWGEVARVGQEGGRVGQEGGRAYLPTRFRKCSECSALPFVGVAVALLALIGSGAMVAVGVCRASVAILPRSLSFATNGHGE